MKGKYEKAAPDLKKKKKNHPMYNWKNILDAHPI